jgi:type II secretory pathway pseudopilin PulG
MRFYRNVVGRGVFSLMEITVVLVVLGVVGAIVGPRISRGAGAAAGGSPHLAEQVLVGQLRSLRAALDAYAADHGGRYPDGDVTRITRELTQYSDQSGAVHAIASARYPLGPYLSEIPALHLGSQKGAATLGLPGGDPGAGWRYDPATGRVHANTGPEDSDALGRPYSEY